MQTYTIDSDLVEQRQKLIGVLLGISLLVGLPVFGFTAALSAEVSDAPLWIFFAVVLFAANTLRRWQRVALSAWVYLGGLIAILGLSLATYGPSATTYLLFFIPIVLAALLL